MARVHEQRAVKEHDDEQRDRHPDQGVHIVERTTVGRASAESSSRDARDLVRLAQELGPFFARQAAT
jgi:hypothetical protein